MRNRGKCRETESERGGGGLHGWAADVSLRRMEKKVRRKWRENNVVPLPPDPLSLTLSVFDPLSLSLSNPFKDPSLSLFLLSAQSSLTSELEQYCLLSGPSEPRSVSWCRSVCVCAHAKCVCVSLGNPVSGSLKSHEHHHM